MEIEEVIFDRHCRTGWRRGWLEAQDLAAVAQRSWQLIPGIFVVLAVLMFSFVGDGLRDAADPYQ